VLVAAAEEEGEEWEAQAVEGMGPHKIRGQYRISFVYCRLTKQLISSIATQQSPCTFFDTIHNVPTALKRLK
jgi:hypothetical protein